MLPIARLLLQVILLTAVLLNWHYYSAANNKIFKEFQIVIPYGQPNLAIARTLIREGVFKNTADFTLTYWLLTGGRTLKAGGYTFKEQVSSLDVLRRLYLGQVDQYRITIPEGFTNYQIIKLLQNYPNLQGIIASEYWEKLPEGSFLPETYYFTLSEDRLKVLQRMQTALETLMNEVWYSRPADFPLNNPRELITLASIVEKETGKDEERPRVAAVFFNRLKQKIKLQSDATVVYGLTLGRFELERSLKREDLKNPTPYNTYINHGLPPTPIANPGKASIIAVVQPLQTKELFFVADGKGGHSFAETLEQHNKNIQEWLKIIRKPTTPNP
ncbi:MAG TPA: endolytic transglycosylase MltG [Alphaproteobacteria bacterium]|nr:endolytic transglycosylase MltG [Alphaproteobacteria bacterium]